MGAPTSETDFYTRLFRGAERRAPGGEAIAARIASMLAVESGDKVLVMGCGAGVVARMIARTSRCFVTCADRDEASLGALKAVAQKDGVEGLLTPVKGDFKTMPPPPVGYQAVVVEGSLRYLGQSFDECVADARKFLTQNGLLVVSATARVGRTIPSAVESLYVNRGEALRPPWQLSTALEEAGFEPLAAEAYSEAVMDEWYRYIEQAMAVMPMNGEADAKAAEGLKKEIDVYRREGGRAAVNEVLFIARRKEPGEKPPPSRGGE
ncbi:MAG: class I SAM-dependent methyltransferase [Myxococcales bacterium]